MKREILIDIVAYLFSILFIYTGVMKLTDHFYFWSAVMKSHILHRYSTIISWVVPISELLVATTLLLPKTRRVGLFGALSLMVVFTIYVGYNVFYLTSTQRPCTCGGIIQKMSWHQHLYFNGFFTLLVIAALLLDFKINRGAPASQNASQYHLSAMGRS